MSGVDLTKGPTGRQLFSLAFPLGIAIAANMSFNLIDTYFVGQLGIEQLTAISFSFPVVIILLNLAIGIGIGVSSVLSRLIGKGEQDLVKVLGFKCVLVTVVVSFILALVGVLTIGPVFTLIGAESKHIPYIEDYMQYAYFATAFRMISISVSGSFRAHGKTMIPSAAIVTLAIANTILDPLLIFGLGPFPEMGIAGAGIATLISNFIALSFELYVALFRYKIIKPCLKLHKKEIRHLLEVTRIGLPSAIGNALNPLSLSLGNYFLSLRYTEAVAGLGIGSKIQIFSMIPAMALSAGLGPLIGQNYGKSNSKRLKKAMKTAFYFCSAWGVIQGLALYLGADFFSQFFSKDQKALEYSSFFLRVNALTLFGYSFVIMASSMFNAVGKPIKGFAIIALRTLVLFVGLYFLFNSLGVKSPVAYGYGLANLICAVVSLAMVLSFLEIKSGS